MLIGSSSSSSSRSKKIQRPQQRVLHQKTLRALAIRISGGHWSLDFPKWLLPRWDVFRICCPFVCIFRTTHQISLLTDDSITIYSSDVEFQLAIFCGHCLKFLLNYNSWKLAFHFLQSPRTRSVTAVLTCNMVCSKQRTRVWVRMLYATVLPFSLIVKLNSYSLHSLLIVLFPKLKYS